MFGPCVKAGLPTGNLCMHRRGMQKDARWDLKPQSSCCKRKVPITASPYNPLQDQKI